MMIKDDFLKKLESIKFENCECRMWGYRANHSLLFVRLFPYPVKTSIYEHLYLEFHSVYYFSGPMQWSGASLRYGTRDENMRLLDSGLVSIPENMVDEFLAAHGLFVFDGPGLAVNILASRDVLVIDRELKFDVSESG
jgi:hypothetical protein